MGVCVCVNVLVCTSGMISVCECMVCCRGIYLPPKTLPKKVNTGRGRVTVVGRVSVTVVVSSVLPPALPRQYILFNFVKSFVENPVL